MATETKVTDQETGDVTPAKDGSATAGDVRTQFTDDQMAEIQKMIQSERDKTATKLKAEKDRETAKLQNELNELKRAQLTEEERIKAELEDAKSERDRTKQEASQFRRQLTVEKMVRKYNLPESFASRLQGTEEAEIEADAQSIAEFFKTEIQRQASEAVNQKLSGKPPVGGQTPDVSDFQAQYDAAKTKGDAALMLTIQRRAAAAGEQVKQF